MEGEGRRGEGGRGKERGGRGEERGGREEEGEGATTQGTQIETDVQTNMYLAALLPPSHLSTSWMNSKQFTYIPATRLALNLTLAIRHMTNVVGTKSSHSPQTNNLNHILG